MRLDFFVHSCGYFTIWRICICKYRGLATDPASVESYNSSSCTHGSSTVSKTNEFTLLNMINERTSSLFFDILMNFNGRNPNSIHKRTQRDFFYNLTNIYLNHSYTNRRILQQLWLTSRSIYTFDTSITATGHLRSLSPNVARRITRISSRRILLLLRDPVRTQQRSIRRVFDRARDNIWIVYGFSFICKLGQRRETVSRYPVW